MVRNGPKTRLNFAKNGSLGPWRPFFQILQVHNLRGNEKWLDRYHLVTKSMCILALPSHLWRSPFCHMWKFATCHSQSLLGPLILHVEADVLNFSSSIYWPTSSLSIFFHTQLFHGWPSLKNFFILPLKLTLEVEKTNLSARNLRNLWSKYFLTHFWGAFHPNFCSIFIETKMTLTDKNMDHPLPDWHWP